MNRQVTIAIGNPAQRSGSGLSTDRPHGRRLSSWNRLLTVVLAAGMTGLGWGIAVSPLCAQQGWTPVRQPRLRSTPRPAEPRPPVGGQTGELRVAAIPAKPPQPTAAQPSTAQPSTAQQPTPQPGPPATNAGGSARAAAAAPLGLAADAGQTWAEYDLSSFSGLAGPDENSQQDALDWILRHTGTDVWFGQTMGVLQVTRDRVRVYHSSAVQQQVADVVTRLNSREVDRRILSAHLLTVGSPDWRLKFIRRLERIDVQSPGIEAWMMAREDAAVLLNGLRERVDVTFHTEQPLEMKNGRTVKIDKMRPHRYNSGVELLPQPSWPGYKLQPGSIDEGVRVSMSPLYTSDGSEVEVVVDCRATQIERLEELDVEVPTTVDPRQRVQIQVPQVSSWELHERLRWPADRVLVVSRGLAALPSGPPAGSGTGLAWNLLSRPATRGESLLVLEPTVAVRRVGDAPATGPTAARQGHNRY